jgi:WhiB family redox-sensing transcriptional regulator
VYIVQPLPSSRAKASIQLGDKYLSLSELRFPDFSSKGTAPCAETDPEAFFPDRGGTISLREIRIAKAICNSCPYKSECLEWALENRETGIWGGLTEMDRRRIRRERKVK